MNLQQLQEGVPSPASYHYLTDEEALTRHGIISWTRWQQVRETLPLPLEIGVHVPNTLDMSNGTEQLLQCPLLVLEFPSFADGRAFSQGRQLRQKLGFAGRLRAKGRLLLPDQIRELHYCGFDEVELLAPAAPT